MENSDLENLYMSYTNATLCHDYNPVEYTSVEVSLFELTEQVQKLQAEFQSIKQEIETLRLRLEGNPIINII